LVVVAVIHLEVLVDLEVSLVGEVVVEEVVLDDVKATI
jgi:hypothetical protein